MEQELTPEEKDRLEKADAFAFSLDIVRMAMTSPTGWNIALFKYDPELRNLQHILENNDINPSAFFDIQEFIENNEVESAYDWAREVQRRVFSEYDVRDIRKEDFLKNMELLDETYKGRENPREVFKVEDMEDFDVITKSYIELINTTQSFS